LPIFKNYENLTQQNKTKQKRIKAEALYRRKVKITPRRKSPKKEKYLLSNYKSLKTSTSSEFKI